MVKLASVLILASAALVAGGSCKAKTSVNEEVVPAAVPEQQATPALALAQPVRAAALVQKKKQPQPQQPPKKKAPVVTPPKKKAPVVTPPKKKAPVVTPAPPKKNPPTPKPSPPTTPRPSTSGGSSFTGECLTFHNQFRGQEGKKPLVFSGAVARSAQNYAQVLANADPGPLRPRLVHSNSEFGENLYAFSGPNTVGCGVASKAWFSEKFMFPVGGRFGDTNGRFTWHDYGHYTQMVWGTTSELGCGVAVRDYGRTKTTYVVCQYNKPGNFIGQRIP